MPNQIDMFETRAMMQLVSRLPKPTTFLRDTFFKNVETFTTKHVDADFVKSGRKLAPFVHEKIGGKIVENTGFQTNTFTPALIAPSKVTSAADIATRSAGESVYASKTPAERALEKLAKDYIELEDMVTRREEYMCSQALFGGRIDIVGDGINRVVDFNFTNEKVLSGTDLWSNDASDPLKDLKEAVREVQKRGSVNPDVVIMSSDVADALINHPKVQKLLDIRNMNIGVIEPKIVAPGATYLGRLPGLNLDMYEYNEYYLDDFTDPDNPVVKSLVPEGTLAVAATTVNNTLAYGAVTIMGENGFETIEASRVPESWVERRPARQFVQLNSKPLPIPREVDSWYTLTVL